MSELSEGQHQHGVLRRNEPRQGSCFFCVKERLCTEVTIPENDRQLFIARLGGKKDALFDEVLAMVVSANFLMCGECKKKGAEFFTRVIIKQIAVRYESMRKNLS